jgi:hypothetical protein
MCFEFLTPEDDRWDQFLREVPHDFYHLPGYVRLAARQEEGEAEAVLVRAADNYFFLPYVVRPLAGTGGDLVSPYGYPGPLFRESTPGFVRAAVGEWAGVLRQRGVVSGFFRLHPLFPVPAEALASHGSLIRRGSTVSIDLTLSEREIWDGFRHGHQADIKRAQRRDLVCTLDPCGRSLEELISLYQETMDRVGAADFYYFPRSYFQDLSTALGERLWVCIARGVNGKALAGELFVACGPIVQAHLGGVRTAALALAPTKLVNDFAWRLAKDRGCRVLHLGGGVGSAEDSLFRFKTGFSDCRHPYYTWQVVFREDVYQALTARRLESPGAAARPGFFPAYRA